MGAHPAPKRELKIVPQSLILFDQGYPDAKFLAFLQGNGGRFPMRCKMKWNYVIDETQSDDFMLDLNQDVSFAGHPGLAALRRDGNSHYKPA